jgi:hypothetical protein
MISPAVNTRFLSIISPNRPAIRIKTARPIKNDKTAHCTT